MNRVLPITALLALTGFGLAQEVPDLLRKALESSPRHRYSGTRVVEFRRGSDITRHEEVVFRRGPMLRIEFPSGSRLSGQVIVENPRERRHYFPDKNEIHVLPPRREEAYERLKRLASQAGSRYRLSVRDGEAVAGVQTDQLVVSDMKGNVQQRIYIDPRSGIMLKREVFDPVGAPVGGFEFTKINIRSRMSPELFRFERRGAKIVTPSSILEDIAKKEGFIPVVLPVSTGFRLEWSMAREIEGESVLWQSYTSGDDRLSLFQVKAEVSPERLRRYARGEMNVVYWTAKGSTFILVGSLPVDSLKKIAGPVSNGTATPIR